ncbi:MAG: 6-phosphofructokinase [Brumimicrobium sp.]|nr:6-phosphofructokinase [Brumimicrobium sp.]
MKKIGLFTSGGDSPGMNAAIRAIVKSSIHYGVIPVGIKNGFEGMMNGDFKEMSYYDVDNIIHLGGTVLGSARSEAFKTKDGRKIAISHLEKEGIEGLIVIGGDGSFTGANILSQETDIPMIGLPGTIDNDLFGTEATIGYDTALNTIVSAIDKIRDTASSHRRIFLVEVMGRNSGFLALNSAIASGAESVLIPETVTNIEELAEQIRTQNKGRRSSIIVVAEGDDAGGAVDIMRQLKPRLNDFDFRTTILGHVQRGGSPTYFDRALATRSGVYAVELLLNGESHKMIGISADQLILTPIKDAIEKSAHPDLSKEEILRKMLTSK